MKRKSIIVGSIFVLALILLMPSIPAIQQKTIEDKVYSDFIEKFKDINLDDIEIVKYPLLNALVLFITEIKLNRWLRWASISTELVDDKLVITNPLIFVYSMWILMKLTIWDNFWTILNENSDLNWEYP